VFGENDPVRRRAAIDEIFHEDAVFYDLKGGIFRGRDEIDRIAGVIKATARVPPQKLLNCNEDYFIRPGRDNTEIVASCRAECGATP
jgi:hypothetical protein